MADWIDIAATTECPPGKSIERVAANAMVALANVDGQFYAIDGLCPHQGGATRHRSSLWYCAYLSVAWLAV